MKTLSLLRLFGLGMMLPGLALGADLHPVVTQAVQHQDSYQVKRVFAGRVVGEQRADLGFELAGTVGKVRVDDGDHVGAGQILAELDRRSLEIEKRRLDAQRQEQSSRLDQLQRDLSRYRALREKSYVSEGQLDELATQVSAGQARLSQLEAELQGIALRLEKSYLRAPFAGEVANLRVEEGVVVAPGQLAMQLVQTGQNEAVFGIADRLGGDLRIGQAMTVFGDFGEAQATLMSVANTLDWRTQTRLIRVALPADSGAVDGNTAYIFVPEHRQRAGFWLPEEALLEDMRGTWAVYGLHADGDAYVVVKHSVEALYHYRGRVFVWGELKSGQQVVTEGVHRLAPGQKVRLATVESGNVARAE
ncbi:efflux RND transporter periplasmic adaptor subunit [Spongiibacter taiwanensis]|uniref:efflux RND transporter periplasmic adaptor subunit n=1 Tax=Spongiibacter taiwanensis TaxID=1748242 RepID=UPI0020361993|nr:efflux RND transporter periplasmic adaptor subunit [Spongiibacter taiwanensis]USA43208.1 efflux RND transporter periplasmic adaptor subunit [Spongiibacter taiwanensis]